MASRLELQSKLEELLGSRNVYYQSPKGTVMRYPAIVYYRKNIQVNHANNSMYKKRNCYELIVMDNDPDNLVIETLLALPYCSFDREYKSDNLYHDVLTLYY